MDTASLATGILSNSFAVKKGLPIIKKMQPLIAQRKPFYSFEYFPPKTSEGRGEPVRPPRPHVAARAFVHGPDVGSGRQHGRPDSGDQRQRAADVQRRDHDAPDLHQPAPPAGAGGAGEGASQLGIRNILALQRRPAQGQRGLGGLRRTASPTRWSSSPTSAAQHGDYFGIAVAGYPEGHVQARKSLDDDMALPQGQGATPALTSSSRSCSTTWTYSWPGSSPLPRGVGIHAADHPRHHADPELHGLQAHDVVLQGQLQLAAAPPLRRAPARSALTHASLSDPLLCVCSSSVACLPSARRPSLSTCWTPWSRSKTTTPR